MATSSVSRLATILIVLAFLVLLGAALASQRCWAEPSFDFLVVVCKVRP